MTGTVSKMEGDTIAVRRGEGVFTILELQSGARPDLRDELEWEPPAGFRSFPVRNVTRGTEFVALIAGDDVPGSDVDRQLGRKPRRS